MKDFTEQQGIQWRTVLAYAPMSNGRAERMVKTVKSGIGRVVKDRGGSWDEIVHQVVYRYRRRPFAEGSSPFELMYGVPPRIVADDGVRREGKPSTSEDRTVELLAIEG